MELTRLPHGLEARLVSRVVALQADRVTCEAVMAPDSPWVVEGRCCAFVAVEAAAQAAALLGDPWRGPQIGALVRARTIVCARALLPVGEPYVVSARRAGAAGPLQLFDIEAWDAAGPILEGQIGIYVADAEPPPGHISAKQNH